MQTKYNILECVADLGNYLVHPVNFIDEKSLGVHDSFWEPVGIFGHSLPNETWLEFCVGSQTTEQFMKLHFGPSYAVPLVEGSFYF